jgi:hypothetical protein
MCREVTRIGSEGSTFLSAMIISKKLVVDGMNRSGVKIKHRGPSHLLTN